jgi:phospholipid/cholesterol/gamma-HCH transport system ATP-binding protein
MPRIPREPRPDGPDRQDTSIWEDPHEPVYEADEADEAGTSRAPQSEAERLTTGPDGRAPAEGEHDPPEERDFPEGRVADTSPQERDQARLREEGSPVGEQTAQVVREAPPSQGDDEYAWHTGLNRPTGVPAAVEFIDVHKAFGRNRILRGLNMELPEGKISMILGPSGTGKSVCIKHMVGLLYPDEGDVLVHGESIPNMPDDQLFEVRKKFGVLFQDGALFGSMNLLDNVAFPLRQHTDKSEEEILEIVRRRLGEVGLGHSEDKFPNELSGGMRKRAGFARALVLDPDIVLFDEPDSGLDPVRTALLGELIQEIHEDVMEERKDGQHEHLPCFAVITHDIMSARRVAEYIVVIWRGRVVEAGYAEEMLNSDNQFIRQFLAGESQGPLGMD